MNDSYYARFIDRVIIEPFGDGPSAEYLQTFIENVLNGAKLKAHVWTQDLPICPYCEQVPMTDGYDDAQDESVWLCPSCQFKIAINSLKDEDDEQEP